MYTVDIYSYRGYLYILWISFVKDKVSVSDTNFHNGCIIIQI